MEFSIEITGLEEALDAIRRKVGLFQEAAEASAVLNETGQAMVLAAQKSIDAGGRPTPFAPRKKEVPWPILKKTGVGEQSLYWNVTGAELRLTGVFYMMLHNNGFSGHARKKGGGYFLSFPQRQFFIVQPEVLEITGAAVVKYITENK